MITWILAIILAIWCIVRRFSEGGKIAGEPLGMPRGTVRAFITILIVAFPFGYLIFGEEIPRYLVNAIFIVVAFYFEARRSGEEKLKQIIDEIKSPEIVELDIRKEKKPLYLPKYTVRALLIIMLIITQTIMFIKPDISFQITNTLADLLLIMSLFMVGASFRNIAKSIDKKKIKAEISNMDASLTDIEIIEKIMLREPSWWKKKGKNVLSIIMLILVIIALGMFTLDWNIEIISARYYTLSLSESLLLLINAYYGFRD